MAKITTKATFKDFNPDQPQLLPQNLEELIGQDHLVRVIRRVVDQMDLSEIINKYPGGGSSAYHPQMMIKVLLYAYSLKIYTGRKIALVMRQDIGFMWLAAFNTPDFRTINEFRSGELKQSIEELFKSMLVFLVENKYVKFETYFVDGTPIAADANKHKMVWKKNAVRYKEAVEKKCEELFKEIDVLNEQEDQEYKNHDLEQTGSGTLPITPEKITQQITELNSIIEKTVDNKKKQRRAGSLKKQLEKHQEKIKTYENQLAITGERSGYSKTDTDAVAMHMKNEETLPAYNAIIGTEDQFVVNFSIHQNGSDNAGFKEHMEQLQKHTDKKPEVINGDAGFGSEQNYEIIEEMKTGNFLKYNNFHQEQTVKHKNDRFHKDHFAYDPSTDSYQCPNNRKLTYRRKTQITNQRTGYVSTIKEYRCESCAGCPFAAACKKPKEKDRLIKINEKWERYKKQAYDNLTSEKGILLRKRRGVDVESVFGDLKMNQGFRRFHVRGKEKVKAEFGILVMSHNLRKIHLQDLQKAS